MTLIRLPVAPSVNNLFISVGKKRIKSDGYRQWQTAAGWQLNLMRVSPFGAQPTDIRLMVPNNNRRDLDNYLKPVLDLLVAHKIIADDRFVRRITVERHDDADMLLSILPFRE